MEQDVGAQVYELPQFASAIERNGNWQSVNSRSMVFTGSGDSYAASLFAHYFSGGSALADEPYELLVAPKVCDGKTVFITSLSGRTRANIKLAKRLKHLARHRVAITANPTSPLARECDETIRLPYDPRQTTSGTLSFTLSILAVASQIGRLPRITGLDLIAARAKRWAALAKSYSQTFLIVGTGIGYSLAAYGAFKIHEVLGQHAEYEHTEQVGHSKLFSLRQTDNMICLVSPFERETQALSRDLKKAAFHPQIFRIQARDPIHAALEGAFALQHFTLSRAKRSKLKEVVFLRNRKMLRLSSRLIY